MSEVKEQMQQLGQRARAASRFMAAAETRAKNAALLATVTAIDAARLRGHNELADYLLSNGAVSGAKLREEEQGVRSMASSSTSSMSTSISLPTRAASRSVEMAC